MLRQFGHRRRNKGSPSLPLRAPWFRADFAAKAHFHHALRAEAARCFGADRLAAVLTGSRSIHSYLSFLTTKTDDEGYMLNRKNVKSADRHGDTFFAVR